MSRFNHVADSLLSNAMHASTPDQRTLFIQSIGPASILISLRTILQVYLLRLKDQRGIERTGIVDNPR